MRRLVLVLALLLIIAAAVVYFAGWYRFTSVSLAYVPSPSSSIVEALGAGNKARFSFDVARYISLFLAGLGLLAGVIAYTPWVWQSSRGGK